MWIIFINILKAEKLKIFFFENIFLLNHLKVTAYYILTQICFCENCFPKKLFFSEEHHLQFNDWLNKFS